MRPARGAEQLPVLAFDGAWSFTASAASTAAARASATRAVWDRIAHALAQPLLDGARPAPSSTVLRRQAPRARSRGAYALLEQGQLEIEAMRVANRAAGAGAPSKLQRWPRAARAALQSVASSKPLYQPIQSMKAARSRLAGQRGARSTSKRKRRPSGPGLRQAGDDAADPRHHALRSPPVVHDRPWRCPARQPVRCQASSARPSRFERSDATPAPTREREQATEHRERGPA